MEGGEGIAVAGAGGGHEAGFGLFRAADVTMTEAQEAAKEYQSSPSSPSTSPTPSPPPVAASGHGGEAAATPTMWSLGGEKMPSEAAGDNGMQMSGHSEHASLSSGRRRGRPKGSGRRQILATLGQYLPSKIPSLLYIYFCVFGIYSFFHFCWLFSCYIRHRLWIFLFHCLGWGPVRVMCKLPFVLKEG